MKIFTPPFYSGKINFLLLGGLILFMSCQSDPIVYNPAGGYEYQKKSFQLNKDASKTVQGDFHMGMSPRLYSGILLNGDRVSTLIRLLPEVLDSHEVCSADSISKVNISLSSITQLADEDTNFLIQKDSIQIQLISLNEIWDEDIVLDPTKLSTITNTINATPTISNSLIEIKNQSIDVQLYDHDSDIIQHWCETREELGIVVSYIPTDTTYLEFYSSDSNEGPRLFVEYTDTNTVSNSYNRYLFNNVYWTGGIFDESDNGPHYIEVALSDNWDVINIYALNLKENSQIPSLEIQIQSYDTLLFQDDIITTENLNTDISFLTINVDLNTDIEEIDSIMFSLINAIAFRSDDDPAGDNWNEVTNPNSLENNGIYDDGEIFNDDGIDNCPDEMEIGNGECASLEEVSAFNSIGTEGNNQRDWTDYDGDGKWDLNEGEMWGDWGSDWCPDSLEDGSGGCLMEPPDIQLGYDPNGDNIDPSGDDWDPIYLVGNEGNGKFDFIDENGNDAHDKGERCEPFKDWGTDGLPYQIAGNKDENDTEGNGRNDFGEPFDDSGLDSLFNVNEFGYDVNRTEGNGNFDGKGEYYDCGEDNCCDSKADEGLCEDVGDDNYNIDPNKDNWNDCGSDNICPGSDVYTNPDLDETEGNNEWDINEGTEKNHLLNWTDANDENGVWNEGEGEKWFDWGLDGIQDSLEAFHVSSVIPIERYDNSYIFDLDEEILQPAPDLKTDTVSLWISEIRKVDDNSLNIEVSVQSNKALKGLQFQLYHTPFTKLDTTLETYTHSITQIGEDKLFEDFTLLPKSEYDPLVLDTTLQINYANDVAAFLDFDSLNLFLENKEYIFSPQYSNLVFYIDATNTDIHEDGMWVYLTHSSDLGDDGSILGYPTYVPSSSDSVEISMGQILRAYQSGSLGSYNGFKLKANDILYNYSKLSIKNNPRIDVIYSQ